MPYKAVKLNDGRSVPQIGFGSAGIPTSNTVDNVDLAIELGFNHIDTAQAYGNEEQVGLAIKESALSRKDIWVTTKWSGYPWGNGDSISPADSIKESLERLHLSYVDLYLIHTPRLVKDRIKDGWNEIIELHKQGLAKSIGVSNFQVEDLKELLESEKGPEILPAVNQIELHPYVWEKTKDLVEYSLSKGIAIEAYSPLKPLTTFPGGPLDKPVQKIADRFGVKPEAILLAWIKSKGAVILTTSTKKERLETYIAAGDIDLTEEDIKEIEAAGKKGPKANWYSLKIIAVVATLQAVAFYILNSPK